ncbi:MAG: hypothetical protein K2X09_03560 [Rickettsiales bacterium]|nr:hypothetical protein [Rickettsiales bacterium]
MMRWDDEEGYDPEAAAMMSQVADVFLPLMDAAYNDRSDARALFGSVREDAIDIIAAYLDKKNIPNTERKQYSLAYLMYGLVEARHRYSNGDKQKNDVLGEQLQLLNLEIIDETSFVEREARRLMHGITPLRGKGENR